MIMAYYGQCSDPGLKGLKGLKDLKGLKMGCVGKWCLACVINKKVRQV